MSSEPKTPSSSSSPLAPNPEQPRNQTTGTGKPKLVPPTIRIEPCRCVLCGGKCELVCKQCREEIVYCKKCARRAKHGHPLKAFRARDEELFTLRKHLLLSYAEHIVSCTNNPCMDTCVESRYIRKHFDMCPFRPHSVLGLVRNDEFTYDQSNCPSCGLFITCMFVHADKCHVENCHVGWCSQIRQTFDVGHSDRPIHVIDRDMDRKCREVHHVEWKKVEKRRHFALLDEMRSITI